ncbi:cobalamin biosynthesis protein CobD/CbiB [Pseudoalteromonas sp. SSDWG2]|uniref:cobalamin biosynthesis protein CobD/CbiB n=1 Tax=Pseudoalteromonas sp. SSDWG2 TaxID=3139391 RepID=UPI003BAD503B
MTWDTLGNYSELLLVLAAIALERWLPLPSWYHPFTLVRLIFSNLVKRTYQPTHTSPYLLLASVLSIALCVLLPLVLISAFSQLVYYPELLNAFLLYLSLSSHTLINKVKRTAQALKQHRKSLARAILGNITVRETTRLSEAGIAKASIESLVLRMLKDYFTPLFLYCVFGGLAAFSYALLWQLHQAMRMHAMPNSAYLIASKWLLSVCQLPALVLYLGPLLFSRHALEALRFIKVYGQHFYHRSTGIILSFFSARLQIQLGGPAFYHDMRFEKMRVSLHRQPQCQDIGAAVRAVEQINALWLAVIIFSYIISA